MGKEITVALPDDVARRAEGWARLAGQPVADFLALTIESSLRPLGNVPEADHRVETWTDEEVMRTSALQMEPADDSRLSELLERQQAGQLPVSEQGELAGLMELYGQGMVRKACALAEAVRRGLRGPLEP